MAIHYSSAEIPIKKYITVEARYGHAIINHGHAEGDVIKDKDDKYCMYCGSVRNRTRVNCRNCGAC